MVAVIVSIVLLISEHRSSKIDGFRSTLSFFVDPLKYLVDLPTVLVEKTGNFISSYKALKIENEKLREVYLINQTKMLKFSALENENIRLRALLENSFKLGEQVLVAELLSVNIVPYEHLVVVNKGTRFGVHPQQPVLGLYCAVKIMIIQKIFCGMLIWPCIGPRPWDVTATRYLTRPCLPAQWLNCKWKWN